MDRDAIHSRFQWIAAEAPDQTAVADRERNLSYRELDERSDRVAVWLRQRGIGPGSLVPVVAHRSAELIIALVAVAKSGAAYVPVDASFPAKRRQAIIGQCRLAVVLATAADQTDEAMTTTASIVRSTASEGPFQPPEVAGTDPVYVVFTSGTTGVPKGVVIEHHSLTHLIDWHNKRFTMGPDCRTTLMVGVGFDVSQWEIWSSLAAGATIHVVDDEIRSDPASLMDFYAARGITHANAPTVLIPDLVRTSPPASLRLRYLFCAGEKLHPQATAHLPYTLVDYYGPTEATIFATCRVVPPHSEHEPYSIGVPVADTEAFILDQDLNDVPYGEAGELCLAGGGLARGYLDSPDLSAQRFVYSARLGRRLYRTGDLARWLDDGTIQFLGRHDEQVKIRGYRIELGDVESALMRHPRVKAAAVVADQGTPTTGQRLVAFVVPHTAPRDEDRFVAAVRADLRHELPDYMVPAVYRLSADLPVTANGKTDRVALREQLSAEHRRPVNQQEFDEEFERGIAMTWRDLLGHDHFDANDEFFDVGGHSMLAAAMVEEVGARLGAKAYIRDVYEYPSVRKMADELRRRSGERPLAVKSEPIQELKRDIWLPAGFAASGGYDIAQLSRPRHILLTGATGFIGVHLLGELLATTDAHVHCPVRGANAAVAADRLRRRAEHYRLELDFRRISVYPADLAEPRLGMASDDYSGLAGQVDLVYHSASAVNFIQPYSYMKRDNVQGLRELLSFATDRKIKPLILLSTISVFSWGHRFTGKTLMSEDDDIDQNLPAVSADLGYVRSKWVMEKIADLAAERGLPLMTFRCGYATCHSGTGICADYQWWGRLIQTCTGLHAVPDLHDLREGLTTVDYMSQAIAAVSRQPEALGQSFNVVPSPEQSLTLREFFDLLARHCGLDFAVLPTREWVALWENDPQAPMYPLRSMLLDDMYHGESILELYQHTYRWDTSKLRRHLEATPVREPEFTPEILARYLRHLQIPSHV